MKILLITDAWRPQVNGVVRTLSQIIQQVEQMGHEVKVVGPHGETIACPTYPEIRLTINPRRLIRNAVQDWRPDAIHIATEGPLGWAARGLCLQSDLPFTTSFHTRFPEYLKQRFGIPRRVTMGVLKKFHCVAERILVPALTTENHLREQGLDRAVVWGRGVDTETFHPRYREDLGFQKPVLLYVGRLAPEKNLAAFLNLKSDGQKIVVGDGPLKASLQRDFPNTKFTGALFGNDLARWYASADVFVFPSRTDTFGLVMLEALASGTPVAAFPVQGPNDVITDPLVGTLSEDLGLAVERCLNLNREDCRRFAEQHSWKSCAEIFLANLALFQSTSEENTRQACTAQIESGQTHGFQIA